MISGYYRGLIDDAGRSVAYIDGEHVWNLLDLVAGEYRTPLDELTWGDHAPNGVHLAWCLICHATRSAETAELLADDLRVQVVPFLTDRWEVSRQYVRTWCEVMLHQREKLAGGKNPGKCPGCPD